MYIHMNEPWHSRVSWELECTNTQKCTCHYSKQHSLEHLRPQRGLLWQQIPKLILSAKANIHSTCVHNCVRLDVCLWNHGHLKGFNTWLPACNVESATPVSHWALSELYTKQAPNWGNERKTRAAVAASTFMVLTIGFLHWAFCVLLYIHVK